MARKAVKKKTRKKPANGGAPKRRAATKGEPAPLDPIAEALRRRRAHLLAR